MLSVHMGANTGQPYTDGYLKITELYSTSVLQECTEGYSLPLASFPKENIIFPRRSSSWMAKPLEESPRSSRSSASSLCSNRSSVENHEMHISPQMTDAYFSANDWNLMVVAASIVWRLVSSLMCACSDMKRSMGSRVTKSLFSIPSTLTSVCVER